MRYPLDALDVRILDLLQRDATLPIADIAERVASSKTVVWRRIQKLLDAGVIRGRVAVLDHRKVGLGVMVIAHVKMARHGRDVLPRFIEAVQLFPQVIECHTLMGDVDFLLKIMVESVEDYEQFFWQKLSKIDGVQEISSSISMSQTVYTTRLPLRPLRD
ncbi:transcriptional regulator, AsnC family [Fontimonas thermophila]|uniref:Transcriptional regulator, AsnC family n=1 Tax=Fontimonas thermophila TaxID=1076937 RepID=A0A1I2JX63_9GAMM|nr:Lrp/AsnC family transcriptional regulator [Fontimonas thermophila]SFF57346.1 transcriptional regulator, AsnC family [Fontimonas thermophila]